MHVAQQLQYQLIVVLGVMKDMVAMSGFMVDFCKSADLRNGNRLSSVVELPTMVRTLQSASFDSAFRQGNLSVGTEILKTPPLLPIIPHD